jgi:hypothetical protein
MNIFSFLIFVALFVLGTVFAIIIDIPKSGATYTAFICFIFFLCYECQNRNMDLDIFFISWLTISPLLGGIFGLALKAVSRI